MSLVAQPASHSARLPLLDGPASLNVNQYPEAIYTHPIGIFICQLHIFFIFKLYK